MVPKDHLLRKVDNVINFDFIYTNVEELYSGIGRPSIDPVVLIKIVVIQYLFGIPSMRQTIKEIQVNVAYRWFLGYSISEAIPHFSTFSKNYSRRFKNTEVFNNIFLKILDIASQNNLLAPEQVYIDFTHIKASANKKKYKKVFDNVLLRYHEEIIIAALDAGYVTPFIAKTIFESNILPSMPYKRPMTKKISLKNMNILMTN